MSKLKPVGSEKLQGLDKIQRIMEIARYKEVIPQSINEVSSREYQIVLADGQTYSIDKEKLGYVIKKKVNEDFDYVEPMKNRSHYRSYSQAFKKLNLIAQEVNRLTETEENISLFSKTVNLLVTKVHVPKALTMWPNMIDSSQPWSLSSIYIGKYTSCCRVTQGATIACVFAKVNGP